MQAHCVMKAKMKHEGVQNQSALLLTKWFRSVLRRIQVAKVMSEGQPEQDPTFAVDSEDEPPQPPVHYHSRTFDSRLKTLSGKKIVYPINDDSDRIWAKRMDWVLDQHIEHSKDELRNCEEDFKAVLGRSRSSTISDQEHIKWLQGQLNTAHKRIRSLL